MGNPRVSKMAPLLDDRGEGLAKFRVKIMSAGEGGRDAEDGESLVLRSVRIRASSEGDRLSIIFQKSWGNHGQSMCLQNCTFFVI